MAAGGSRGVAQEIYRCAYDCFYVSGAGFCWIAIKEMLLEEKG
jgi:hypothetical protein